MSVALPGGSRNHSHITQNILVALPSGLAELCKECRSARDRNRSRSSKGRSTHAPLVGVPL
jgi:hypothetical protein